MLPQFLKLSSARSVCTLCSHALFRYNGRLYGNSSIVVMELEKSFNPRAIERHWYSIWEEAGYFKPISTNSGGKEVDSNREVPAYCIMLPPPNVTGTLHMGHAFQHTLMDALIRYHRMRGDNTLWQSRHRSCRYRNPDRGGTATGSAKHRPPRPGA